MGKVSVGASCSVEGCGLKAVKSIALEKARAAGFSVADKRRVYLCKEHYKELKKKLKKERAIEKWRYRT